MSPSERIEVIRDVFAFLAEDVLTGTDEGYARSVLAGLDRVDSLLCCPICAEIQCDDYCPLFPVRDALGRWVGSTGAPRA